jgi:hypothetical protein
MNRCFIGIDNGITGAIASLAEDGSVIDLAPLPITTVGRMTTLDTAVFRTLLVGMIRHYRPHILVEPAQMFSPGKKALASTWFCYGGLLAVIEGYPWEPVNPQTWQRAMFADHLREVDQKEDGKRAKKTASIVVAKRLFPNVNLARTEKSKVPDSGLADALLIAEYARRKR